MCSIKTLECFILLSFFIRNLPLSFSFPRFLLIPSFSSFSFLALLYIVANSNVMKYSVMRYDRVLRKGDKEVKEKNRDERRM